MICYEIETKTENRFRNKSVLLWEKNESAKRFWNKIVFLWETKQKCEALLEPKSSVIAKKTEVRSVFRIKLFCCEKEKGSANRFRNKIVPLRDREKKTKSLSEQNCSHMRKKTEVQSVFSTKMFCHGKQNRSAKRLWNKIVLL